MPDAKVTSNGNVTVWLVPVAGILDYRSPTAAEINAGIDITAALAWDGTTFPTSTESDDVDDRSLRDKGNATTRGAASFEATLNFFYPDNLLDTTSDYGKAYAFLRVPRVPVYIVTRVLQTTTGTSTPAAAGQWVSVYRFTTDGWEDDLQDDDSYKYAVSFLTQGEVATYTQVKNATAITFVPTTLTLTGAGATGVIRATLGGKRATQVVKWSSSDVTKATVSQNGVVSRVAAGSATITATHPASGSAATPVTLTIT